MMVFVRMGAVWHRFDNPVAWDDIRISLGANDQPNLAPAIASHTIVSEAEVCGIMRHDVKTDLSRSPD